MTGIIVRETVSFMGTAGIWAMFPVTSVQGPDSLGGNGDISTSGSNRGGERVGVAGRMLQQADGFLSLAASRHP